LRRGGDRPAAHRQQQRSSGLRLDARRTVHSATPTGNAPENPLAATTRPIPLARAMVVILRLPSATFNKVAGA
jgi:hypothetical protein